MTYSLCRLLSEVALHVVECCDFDEDHPSPMHPVHTFTRVLSLSYVQSFKPEVREAAKRILVCVLFPTAVDN